MSVNIVDLVSEVEALVSKGAADAKAVLPLVDKAVNLLADLEPLDPQIAPVVNVVKEVLKVTSEVLSRV